MCARFVGCVAKFCAGVNRLPHAKCAQAWHMCLGFVPLRLTGVASRKS